MKETPFTISWINGEFRITRMQRGFSLERWTAPYPVHDLTTLNKALVDACEHMDLSKGGDLTIAYEDEFHTHEFFEVPNMAKADLNKYLQRKVENNKPFKEKASWCFHEASHGDNEEGIILHVMPQHIVDAIVRVCQEFYLTPKQLVPLSEIVTSITPNYGHSENDLLIVVALFKEQVEVLVTLGNGEVLFIRELPYSGFLEDHQRLVIDINRTIRYVKQKYKKTSKKIWLIGEDAEKVVNEIENLIEGEIDFDPEGLDPFYWASEVSKIKGELSANFIPMLARKKLNRTFFYRVAVWASIVLFTATIISTSLIELKIKAKKNQTIQIAQSIEEARTEIERIETLINTGEREKKRLSILKADNKNLPALFINHLGNMLPAGLIVSELKIIQNKRHWKLIISGKSRLGLSELPNQMEIFETKLTSSPWNITILTSWKEKWLAQLESGFSAANREVDFEFVGEMQ